MGRKYSVLVISLMAVLQLVSHVHGDFCGDSLARKSCPDLATVDTIELADYTGKWYEIGSTANFKNTFEAGVTCAQAVYSEGEEANELKVENSYLLSATDGTIVSVAGISESSSLVCQSARAMCSQVNASDSLLRDGISRVWKLKSDIESSYPTEASSVSTANTKIENAANEIAPKIDTLAKYVSQIQIANSVLSQTDGASTSNKSVAVESLQSNINLANEQVDSIDASFKVMSDAQLDLIKASESLIKKGVSAIASSFTLTEAATRVLAGITAIKAQVTTMSAALDASNKSAELVLEDDTKVSYNVSTVAGTAVRNSTEGGKFTVTFDTESEKVKIPGGKYWILAVDQEPSNFTAALIYRCSELVSGGVDETLWILSRTPQLANATSSSFLTKASSLKIDLDCDAPFVTTVRSPKCPA